MSTAAAPRIGVCVEYQRLLDSCQRTLAAWQQRALADRHSLGSPRMRVQLQRLQAEYAEAYTRLETHEGSCVVCQYISKVGGLDFESLSTALHEHERFG